MTGGCPKDLFWSEILAKRDFWGSMNTLGLFWVAENTGIFLGIVFSINSNQLQLKRNLLLMWDFFGHAKTVEIFLGRQNLF